MINLDGGFCSEKLSINVDKWLKKMSINGLIHQVLLHKSNEEQTEVIFRLLFTFVTCKLKEHLNFSDTFSYLLHNYDSRV